jgi:uncharacterized protein YndB with AHSA1/START domain
MEIVNMTQENAFQFEKTINAPVDLIYRAFTSSTALREWLCDISTTNPEEGGWIYMVWNRGYFASGYYTKLIPEKAVSFKWIGMGEPAWTQIDVTITPLDEKGQYHVMLRHSGVGEGEEWEKAREEISKGWKFGLRNLKSTLEEGQDLRFVERPLIGIYPDDLSELTQSVLEDLNVPVDEGVRVKELVPNYGADQAGIQPDDVIIKVDDQKIDSVRKLLTIMAEFVAGDKISVTAYRENQKMDFVINTKPQKVEVLPETPEELAKELEIRMSRALEALEGVLDDVTEMEASYSPGPEEWSAKETLVHLIHNEREVHTWINDVVAGQERFQDEWPGDNLFRIRATLTTYPTVDDLMAELRRSLKETVATVAFLDQNFTRRKASYWRMGMELLGLHRHIQEHIQQIENNIREARSMMPSG